ncbi:hypothetical protein D3C84_867210 [compost metagenome]
MWEDEDGIDKYQVSKFQIIAASKAAITTSTPFSILAGFAILPPTVLATSEDTMAPTKLSVAAMKIATRGLKARVDIEVAIALAVS